MKYEEVYLKDNASGWEAEESLAAYFRFYSYERIHQALGYKIPEVFEAETGPVRAAQTHSAPPLSESRVLSQLVRSTHWVINPSRV